MAIITEFFFSGTAADLVLLAIVLAIIWIVWALRYNR